MRTPDRRSYDSPRRGSRDRGRDDDFPPPRGRAEPFVPYSTDQSGGRPSPFGSSRPAVSGGPETTAVVKWFNAEKGFGFVELAEGGGDAFLHVSVLGRAGHQTVAPGAVLRVRTSPGQKGPQVADVLSVEEGAALPASTGYGARPAAPRAPRAPIDPGATVEVRGTVKWFNAEKGFGFVTPDTGTKDVFVHITALNRGGLSGLEPNQVVKLQVADGRRGPEAVAVELE